MSLGQYLDQHFKNNFVISLEELFHEVGFDQEDKADISKVHTMIRKHLKLDASDRVPSHYKVRRGKDIILELLG